MFVCWGPWSHGHRRCQSSFSSLKRSKIILGYERREICSEERAGWVVALWWAENLSSTRRKHTHKESHTSFPLTPAAPTCWAPSGPTWSQLRVKRQPEHTLLLRSPNSGWSQVPYVLQKACGTSMRLGLRFSFHSEFSSLFEGTALGRFKVFLCFIFVKGRGGGKIM